VTGFDLRALVAALGERGVEYIVVGGVAVTAHGYVRSTRDLDIVPDPDPANLRRLADALIDVEAVLPLADGRRFAIARDMRPLERRRNITLDTRSGSLDVVQNAPGIPSFATLAQDAVEAEILGVPVRICSLPRLREMKAASGRAQDRADLENLPEPD
jgi:hypothetical protein